MRKWLWFFLFLVAIAACCGGYLYKAIFLPSVTIPAGNDGLFYIETGSDFDDLKSNLLEQGYLADLASFEKVASLMKFNKSKPGRYLLKQDWSNKDLISCLRAGRQEPIKLTFNNTRTIKELAGVFADKLEPDSISILNYFLSAKVLDKENYNKDNILSLFIPNTYEFFWNSSPEKITTRMMRERKKFFTEKRKSKLTELGLTKEELYILASIVQKETLVNEEKPRVAGVYLNRLKRGQLLQADPTVVFASGDFEIRRVLNKHLAIDSPYNTYKYPGLPPGPICMPDVSSIDAVLNYEEHKYLYFCASPDNSGRHQFARNLVEHNRNADKYRRFLNKARIFK